MLHGKGMQIFLVKLHKAVKILIHAYSTYDNGKDGVYKGWVQYALEITICAQNDLQANQDWNEKEPLEMAQKLWSALYTFFAIKNIYKWCIHIGLSFSWTGGG